MGTDTKDQRGQSLKCRIHWLVKVRMHEALLDNGSKWELIVAALLLFGAFSHYPIHRLDRLKPILAHNQHPADGVTDEHSSNTANAGKESCGCFSPVLYRWQIGRYFCVCVCVHCDGEKVLSHSPKTEAKSSLQKMHISV